MRGRGDSHLVVHAVTWEQHHAANRIGEAVKHLPLIQRNLPENVRERLLLPERCNCTIARQVELTQIGIYDRETPDLVSSSSNNAPLANRLLQSSL